MGMGGVSGMQPGTPTQGVWEKGGGGWQGSSIPPLFLPDRKTLVYNGSRAYLL